MFEPNPFFSNLELERKIEFDFKKAIVAVQSTEPIWKEGKELNVMKINKELRNKSKVDYLFNRD